MQQDRSRGPPAAAPRGAEGGEDIGDLYFSHLDAGDLADIRLRWPLDIDPEDDWLTGQSERLNYMEVGD